MNNLDNLTMPEIVQRSGLRHIAFIMDGNGRWAKQRGLSREEGHPAGAENFRTIARYCRSIGIPTCTVYAFSTENIKRPMAEVNAILRLLMEYIKEAEEDKEKDVSCRFIGDPVALAPEIGRRTAQLEKKTAGRPFRLNIALNYGGRAEITHAVNELIKAGKYPVTEEDIKAHLYTADCPDPDLIVRTGSEQRISNFLLWQCAYAEFSYSDKLWPDYSPADVDEAVRDFASRSRRWGGLDQNS